MHKSKSILAKPGLTVMAAVAALAVVSPASAIQADATIDQIAATPSSGAWLVDQVGAPIPAAAYLTQIVAPVVNSEVDFQANVTPFALQLSSADQVPGSAASRGAAVELAFLGYGVDFGRFVRAGQGTSFASDKDGNSQQHAWNGSDNLQASFQRGTENRSIQDQTGLRNASLIVQDGDANFAEAVQSADYTLAAILQVGGRNSASVYQGTNNSFALVSQAGLGNIASIRQ